MVRFPKMGDVMEDVRDELRRLNQNLSSSELEGDTIINVDEQQAGSGSSTSTSSSSQPVYLTTGENGVLVDQTSFEAEIPFGFKANTVNLRFDAPIVVAFRSPHDRESRRIPLYADHSPFTIGDGDAPINAEAIWIKKMDASTNDPVVHLLAKK